MQYIGKLNKNILGKYKNLITTTDVVLTDERKLHIYKNHFCDYFKILQNIKRVILNPDEILIDKNHSDTLLFIGALSTNHLNVIIKLNTTNNLVHKKNSIMTAWIIRPRNLKKIRNNNIILYKKV